MSLVVLVTIFLLHLVKLCCGQQDVITCSGVVKTDLQIDFTKIEIHLYTKQQMILREISDCSPANGYFLLPVYDLGEYIIKIAPPSGWSFSPNEISVTVDGITDDCSTNKDIVFSFIGFSISGKVNTIGKDDGPAGVTVQLLSADLNQVIAQTSTIHNGRFVFNGVPSGSYKLQGAHPTWTVSKELVDVTVANDSVVIPKGSLTIEGYNVMGYIRSNGKPVGGVQFLLYHQNDSQFNCAGDVDALSLSSEDGAPPPCVAVSNVNGTFSYPSLPPGQYKMISHYEDKGSHFEVTPTQVLFVVSNDSLVIDPVFEVHGFTVFGKVLKGKQDTVGLEGLKVEFGSEELTVITDEDGNYKLTNISAGSYTIKVYSDVYYFSPLMIDVDPSSPHLPPLLPAGYSVCGHVTITTHPHVPFKVESCSIQAVVGSEHVTKTGPVDTDGHFCLMLPTGNHTINAMVTDVDSVRGLALVPSYLMVTVETDPINGLEFKQFTSSISGNISYISGCTTFHVGLQRLNDSVQNVESYKTVDNFKFNQVLPGRYIVHVFGDVQWCWETEEVEVEVSIEGDPPEVTFTQTGYQLKVYSSHDTRVIMRNNDDGSIMHSFTVGKGLYQTCINQSGYFSLIPKSCHVFDSDVYLFITDILTPITLKAISHYVNVSVYTPNDTQPVDLLVMSSTNPDKTHQPRHIEQTIDGLIHHYYFTAKPDSSIDVIPQSNKLLCSPKRLHYEVGKDCPEVLPSIKCDRGHFISGRIEPPLEGVVITIATTGADPLVVSTDDKGLYEVGPFLDMLEYTVVAQYDGYMFEALDDDRYSFRAIKKSQLNIKISSDGSAPLEGVLVSLNGESIRASNKTDSTGSVLYTDMSPGQYYIKPLLREYQFNPPSKAVVLDQGKNVEVEFIGKRTAFSCSGKVTSLNGTPLGGVRVKVVSSNEEGSGCSIHSDTMTTDEDGSYKFRALQPKCGYQISVEDPAVEMSYPSDKSIELHEDDVLVENFLIVFKPDKISNTGNVIIDDTKLLTYFKVELYDNPYMESCLYSSPLDPMGFFFLPPLPLDPAKVYYLQIKSDIVTHSYAVTDPDDLSFTADDGRHITIHITTEKILPSGDKHFRGSFVGLFSSIALLFVLANIDKIISYVKANFRLK